MSIEQKLKRRYGTTKDNLTSGFLHKDGTITIGGFCQNHKTVCQLVGAKLSTFLKQGGIRVKVYPLADIMVFEGYYKPTVKQIRRIKAIIKANNISKLVVQFDKNLANYKEVVNFHRITASDFKKCLV